MNRANAIVLRAYPILEHDIIVELFAYDMGRISVFVKYAQSKRPRFGGLIHTLNNVLVDLTERNHRFYLVQAKLVSNFEKIKQNYLKMNVAYHMLSLVRAMTQINHENNDLFNIIINQLNRLSSITMEDLYCFKLDLYKQLLYNEGVLDNKKDRNYSEKELVKMIESYTCIELKRLKS